MRNIKQQIIDMIEAGFELDLILKSCYISIEEFLELTSDFDSRFIEVLEVSQSSVIKATCFDNVAVYIIKLNERRSNAFVFDGFKYREIQHENISQEIRNCERYYLSVLRENKINEIIE